MYKNRFLLSNLPGTLSVLKDSIGLSTFTTVLHMADLIDLKDRMTLCPNYCIISGGLMEVKNLTLILWK